MASKSKVVTGAMLGGFVLNFVVCDANPALAQMYDCEKYARDAVAAHKFSQDNFCGFGGPQWSYNYEGHRNWCRGAQYSSIMNEIGIRSRLVALCSRATTDCNAYAEVAVAQNWYNRNYYIASTRATKPPRCPPGPRWHDDRGAHARWCVTVSPEIRRNELIARYKPLSGGQCP